MPVSMRALLVAAFIALLPVSAFAQAAIAGVVKDASGAALAGVTVEVTSPALIERTRQTSTDRAGLYRFEQLRPGVYLVRFTRTGWRTVEQPGVELVGPRAITVNATLEIGPLAETVSVSRDVPVVDTRNARESLTLEGDLVRDLPTVRNFNALVVLVPGVLTNTNDVITGAATTQFPIHGGRANEGRLVFDGLTVGSPPNGNSSTSYVLDVGTADDVTFLKTGGMGEAETGGLAMHVSPASGGNTTRGTVFASGGSGAWQGDNLTPALRAAGVAAATPLTRVYDFSGTIGGPIARDRAWYFASAHSGGSTRDSAAVYYNANAGDAAKWLYVPDLNRRAYSDRTFENGNARLTWQVTPRNRVSAYWDEQRLCRACTGATPGLSEPAQSSPEAVGVLGRPLRVAQVKWWSPVSARLFVEVGFGGTYFGVGNFERTPNPTRDLVRVVEQCARGCAGNGGIAGLAYRSQDYSVAHTGSSLWQATMAYVTGAHVFKAGYQHALMTDDRTWYTNSQAMTYRVNDGQPDQLTQSISPWVNDARAGFDAWFAQDQWTIARLTLEGALRFDRAGSWFPAQQEGPSRFLPAPIVIPETRGVDHYTDLTPRFGAAYDLSGDGRAALKVTWGRYLEGVSTTGTYANTNPTLRMPQTTSTLGTAGVTRAWTDANGNFTPDCDLQNPQAQDLGATGGDVCGVMSNTLFGRNVLTNNFDGGLLRGWNVRPSDWDLAVMFERQLAARSSFTAAYVRRTFRGFSVADNLALSSADLTPYSITAPIDARLPDGGGYTISGLYDVVPGKAGQVDNLVADSRGYGRWRQYFNGVDATADVRLGHDVSIAAGASVGQTVTDNCDVRAALPELSTAITGTSPFGAGLMTSAVTPTSPYCHVATGALGQVRGLASGLIPVIRVRVSATVQSRPGPMLAANYVVPDAAVVPSLGRNLAGGATSVTVNLLEPGSRYGNRLNEVDLRVAKTVRLGRSRTRFAADLYNLLNSSAVLTYNNTFVPGGVWLQPLTIMTPRFLRITVECTF